MSHFESQKCSYFKFRGGRVQNHQIQSITITGFLYFSSLFNNSEHSAELSQTASQDAFNKHLHYILCNGVPLLILTFLAIYSFLHLKNYQKSPICFLGLAQAKLRNQPQKNYSLFFVCRRNTLIDVFGKVRAV